MITLSARVRLGIPGSRWDTKTFGTYGYAVVPHPDSFLPVGFPLSDAVFVTLGVQEGVMLTVKSPDQHEIFDIYRSCQNPNTEMRRVENFRHLTTIFGQKWLDLNQVDPGRGSTAIFLGAGF
jgi:hypothetical protein